MCPMCDNCDYKDEAKQKECVKLKAACEDRRKECEAEQRQLIERKEFYVYWNTTVSDNCCLYCNNTVYKADTVIDTTQLEDKCESEETHVCRKIPGIIWHKYEFYHLSQHIKGLQKAKIETEFRYGVCCNDDEALKPLNTTELQASTCSQRECIRPENAPFAVWISKPVRLIVSE